MVFMSNLFVARYAIMFVLKYIFARHTVGIAGTNVARSCTYIFGINKINGHLMIIHEVLRTMDQAPHNGTYVYPF